ncbi:hypothetical protein ACQKKK_16855 [Peribacillus sp. NPDC006672]|uniref:hypothetical protein n=1 Tax=Peribacillus sp. NPDC006672 TaxID=3390606 RepID=UPI003D06484A
MKLLSILGGNAFVMFNKELAHEVSVNGAIIFGQLCSSYESFGSKNMLSKYRGEEYFYLTSDTIQEETALSYKQQAKAIKDLEEAGYIKTVIMGSPARKYFHITNKIIEQLKEVSSDKRGDLNNPNTQEIIELRASSESIRFDKREEQACNKGQSKPLPFSQAYKDINKKEKDKKNNHYFNCNFKESLTSDKFRELLTNTCNEFYTQFTVGRWSKKSWNILIDKFVDDTITSGRWTSVPEDKIKGYAYKSLEKICYNSDYKHDDEINEFRSLRSKVPEGFYNWLES